jgi:hypothetical protein
MNLNALQIGYSQENQLTRDLINRLSAICYELCDPNLEDGTSENDLRKESKAVTDRLYNNLQDLRANNERLNVLVRVLEEHILPETEKRPSNVAR